MDDAAVGGVRGCILWGVCVTGSQRRSALGVWRGGHKTAVETHGFDVNQIVFPGDSG